MAESDFSEGSLKKLNVAQLRALCKERRIVGYWKISKDLVIGKLLHWQQHQPAQLPSNDAPSDTLSINAPSSSAPRTVAEPPGERTLDSEPNYVKAASKPANLPPITLSQSPEVPSISIMANHTSKEVPDTNSMALSSVGETMREMSMGERPAAVHHPEGEIAHEKQKENTSNIASTHMRLNPKVVVANSIPGRTTKAQAACATRLSKRTSDEHELSPCDTGNTKKKTKTDRTAIILGQNAMPPPSLNIGTRSAQNEIVVNASNTARTIPSQIRGSNRFKPLNSVISGPTTARNPNVDLPIASKNQITSQNHNLKISSFTKMMRYFDFEPCVFTIPLKPISLPPSVSQRKRVPRLALILSEISSEDLKACALVSRFFRYSAYLAATSRLTRKFNGKRLQEIIARYPPNITNFWPYLFHREEEAATRERMYADSFLGRILRGVCGIKKELWANPDHEKQANIAVRFLLTKLFFYISIGHGTEDFTREKGCRMLLDVQEVVPNEIWKVAFASLTSVRIFYVLEATCEVIGQADASGTPSLLVHTLRADWSHYISTRLESISGENFDSLWDHVHWTNHEEYYKGISKQWLSRLQKGDAGLATLAIAQRYVLACLISNSVSGTWLTSSEMCQDFNGVPKIQSTRKQKSQRVNLFLPAHHHVESVHFTTSSGESLHPALAVVQTPAREYFILKDNGMQVGCEEDGIAPIWMELLDL